LENSVTPSYIPASNDAGPLLVGAGRYTISNTPNSFFQGQIKNIKINKFIVIPQLTFDTYNKLTFSSLELGSTSNVLFNGNTYSIGTASNVYIENTGTYEAESKGTSTFALTSNVVGTVTQVVKYDYSQAQSTEQKITASDAASNDLFGWSVSLSGDYAIVGARGNSGTGAAYIYTRNTSTGGWVGEQKIQASDNASDDRFGYSVSLSGDYAIVGARNEDTGGSNAGAVYIYTRTHQLGNGETNKNTGKRQSN